MEKKVNVNINEGDAFFAHEVSMNFNPMQFSFDFKCITPRQDMRSSENAVIALKHNVVMVDPYHAKSIHELLGRVITDYEKKFGKIEKPKALKKIEKDAKKKIKEDKKTTMPSYLG